MNKRFSIGQIGALAVTATLLFSACQNTSNPNDKSGNMSGDTPGTGSVSSGTGYEDSEHPYRNERAMSGERVYPSDGVGVEVRTEEGGGNSRLGGDSLSQTGSSTYKSEAAGGAGEKSMAATRLDRKAGQRARYTLIGSNEKNRSRLGQSLRADNMEQAGEFTWGNEAAASPAAPAGEAPKQ